MMRARNSVITRRLLAAFSFISLPLSGNYDGPDWLPAGGEDIYCRSFRRRYAEGHGTHSAKLLTR